MSGRATGGPRRARLPAVVRAFSLRRRQRLAGVHWRACLPGREAAIKCQIGQVRPGNNNGRQSVPGVQAVHNRSPVSKASFPMVQKVLTVQSMGSCLMSP